jgi:biotin operon repressor
LSFPLPVYRDRPTTLPDPENPGWVDLISVHDADYLRVKAEWRQKLAAAHPDRGGTELGFHRTKKAQEAWSKAQTDWYAKRGLTPPETSSPRAPLIPADVLALVDARPGKVTRTRVASYRDAHPDATTAEIAKALGLSSNVVGAAICRLRRHGRTFPNPPKSGLLFRLLADGQPHTLAECRIALGMAHHNELSRAARTLRERGFEVVSTRRAGVITYRLLSAPER